MTTPSDSTPSRQSRRKAGLSPEHPTLSGEKATRLKASPNEGAILPPTSLGMAEEEVHPVDKLKEMEQSVDSKFKEMEQSVDSKFKEMEQSVDSKFKEMEHSVDVKFKSVDSKFKAMDKRFDDIENLLKKVLSRQRTGDSNKSRSSVSIDPVDNTMGSFEASLLGTTDKDTVDEGGDEVVFNGSVSTKGMEPSGSVHSGSVVSVRHPLKSTGKISRHSSLVTPVKVKTTAENAREAWSKAPKKMNDWPTGNDRNGVEDISDAGGVKQIPTAQPPPMSPQEASTYYEPQLDHFLPPLYFAGGSGRNDNFNGVDVLAYHHLKSLGILNNYVWSDIMNAHGTVMAKWNLYNGPRDKDIHDASKFPNLENCRVDTLVSWYQSIQPRLASYCIGLTPFDGIELSFGYQGLCIPGLGIKRYRPMALALYEILITKLPREHQTLLGLFDVGTKDGYHLFWSFFCLTLPIFNTDMELKYPKFADHSGDVEQFARATVIYHKFERMDGRNMNQRHKVMKYLTTLSKAVDWPIVHVKLDCVSRCPGDLSLPVDSQYGTLPPSLSLAQVTADIMQYLRNRQHDPTLGTVDTYHRTNMLEAQMENKGTIWKEYVKPETEIAVLDPVANTLQRRHIPHTLMAQDDDFAQEDAMWDPGANMCITPFLHLLTNIVKITPFAVEVAVKLSSFPNKEDATLMCTMKGDLMLPLVDGGYHTQQCHYNPHAMNTLVSPQAICEDSHGQFSQWSMEANTTGQPGRITFKSTQGDVLISIPLHLKNGVWHCKNENFLQRGPNPIACTPMIKKEQDTTLLSKVYQTVNQSLSVSESQESSEGMDSPPQASDNSRHNNSQLCNPKSLPTSKTKSTTDDAHGNTPSNSANTNADRSTSLAKLRKAEIALYKKWGPLLGFVMPDEINDNPNNDGAKDAADKANSLAATAKARTKRQTNSYINDRRRKMKKGDKEIQPGCVSD